MTFWERWENYRQKTAALGWEGTFRDYLELVRADASIARSAHGRLYDLVCSAGAGKGQQGNYDLFAEQIFGIDQTLERLVEDYLHPAALGLEVRKRVLLLMGPVSGGKSTIITLLKRGLEAYSCSPEGALYGIKGCPMQEEPLHLVPASLREELSEELGVVIEGELCPLCSCKVEQEYGGRIDRVPVERVLLSEARRVGIGTFSPSDPKSQDVAELVGSLDFAALGKYGAESDPRAYRFDGELNRANRGLLEFQELLKCDEKFLYHLLSLTQEGNFKTGRYALISADEVIMAHTNEHEYRSFINSHGNEALKSRLMVLPVPYTFDIEAQKKIYTKGMAGNRVKVHWSPYALKATSLFTILTRVKNNQQFTPDVVARLKAGQSKDGGALSELGDGLTGLDPRFIQNRLSSVVARQKGKCITALDVLGSLQLGLQGHPGLSSDEKKRYLFLVGLVEKEYGSFVQKELRKACLTSFAQEGRGLFRRYIQALTFYCENQSALIKDGRSGFDEELMGAVEQHLDITEPMSGDFRREILSHIRQWRLKGKEFDYNAHPQLREAIQEKLFWDLKRILQLSVLNPAIGETDYRPQLIKTLKTMDYCDSCAISLLEYGSELL